MKQNSTKGLLFFLCLALLANKGTGQSVGIFESHGDVGAVLHPGAALYDSKTGDYRLTGSGANIWAATDEFQFAWRKLKGNFILQARARLTGKGVDPHRKLGWMVRKTLQGNSPSVNATVHGDGLTSLQYRETAAGEMKEKKFETGGHDIIQLERRGNTYLMSAAHNGELFQVQEVEAVDLGDEVYVGLFVCAHNKDRVETGVFDNVRIVVPAKETLVAYREYIGSNIELYEMATGKRKTVYSEKGSLQAPNWTRDGKSLLYNSEGLIYKLDLQTRKAVVLNTGEVKNNNNDHVLSFDGKMLGLSSASPDKKYNSVVYTVAAGGGTPQQITPTGPSYLHGWSPDKKFLVFTGQRNGDFDIYRVPAGGGEEVRLTTTPGLDDGPEYSPDGKYIYFNSVRSGRMQIWRMRPDGTEQTQLTNDTLNNWFPHLSPDNKTIVFLSFGNDVKPDDHPFYKHVYLRTVPVSGGRPTVLAYLYGGQGTINTPSWSPDSKQFAFVSNSDLLPEK